MGTEFLEPSDSRRMHRDHRRGVAVKCFAPAILLIAFLPAELRAESCLIKNPFKNQTNVRDSPRGVAILKRLKNGDAVQFIAGGKDRLGADWGNVTGAGLKGWVLRQYLDCASRQFAPGAALPEQPPPGLKHNPETPATAARPLDLSCDLHGECLGSRLGIHSDDHSCPVGLGVLNGAYKIVLNYTDNLMTVVGPDQTPIALRMACNVGKCQATGGGLYKTTKWTLNLLLTNNNSNIEYKYEVTSDFSGGISFSLTHLYHGNCTREPPG